MKKFFLIFVLIFSLISCVNNKTKEIEYPEKCQKGEGLKQVKDNFYSCKGDLYYKYEKDLKEDNFSYDTETGKIFDIDYSYLFTEEKGTKILGQQYIKNNGTVYYLDEETNIDSETFEEIKGGKGAYAKDKNGIYNKGILIEGVDEKSFEIINNYYSKDKENIYYKSRKIEGANLNSFKILGEFYSKDKNNVYYIEEKIEGADLNSFKIFETKDFFIDSFGKDKNHIYFGETEIEGADLKTFKPLVFTYGKDKNNVYYEYEKIKGADTKTFEIINEFYSKDKDFIYFKGVQISEDIDTKTFEFLDKNYFYAKDKENIYHVSYVDIYKIEGTDKNSFEILNKFYSKDKKNVYYKDEKIDGVNPKEFYTSKDFESYGFDKKNIYSYGDKIEQVDFDTFHIIDAEFSKDKENIYFYNEKSDFDVTTFEIVNNYTVKDKNGTYTYNSKTFKYEKVESEN